MRIEIIIILEGLSGQGGILLFVLTSFSIATLKVWFCGVWGRKSSPAMPHFDGEEKSNKVKNRWQILPTEQNIFCFAFVGRVGVNSERSSLHELFRWLEDVGLLEGAQLWVTETGWPKQKIYRQCLLKVCVLQFHCKYEYEFQLWIFWVFLNLFQSRVKQK